MDGPGHHYEPKMGRQMLKTGHRVETEWELESEEREHRALPLRVSSS